MSFTNVYIHAVWGTKNRERILVSEAKQSICSHIRQNALVKGFYIAEVNGHLDHLHCLMSLRPDWSLAKQMQMIKGESARWANQNQLLPQELEWADGYYAASVSEDGLPYVRAYIRNQEVHHQRISFEEEYAQFLKTLRSR